MYTTRRKKVMVPYIFLGKVAAVLVIMVALFLIVLLVLPEKSASAENTPVGTYTITSVEIQEGDSLWSLAEEYYTNEFHCVTNFITEIKRMNGLSNDTLYAGNYILIPQYIMN